MLFLSTLPSHAVPLSQLLYNINSLNISTTISHINNHNTFLAHQEKRQEYEQKEAQPGRQVHLSQLFLASQLSMDLEDILDSPDLDSCQMCHQGMRLAKTFALQAPDLVPGLLRELCLKYKFRRPDTCEGKKLNTSVATGILFSDDGFSRFASMHTVLYSSKNIPAI